MKGKETKPFPLKTKGMPQMFRKVRRLILFSSYSEAISKRIAQNQIVLFT
jgi:hypothetical protein